MSATHRAGNCQRLPRLPPQPPTRSGLNWNPFYPFPTARTTKRLCGRGFTRPPHLFSRPTISERQRASYSPSHLETASRRTSRSVEHLPASCEQGLPGQMSALAAFRNCEGSARPPEENPSKRRTDPAASRPLAGVRSILGRNEGHSTNIQGQGTQPGYRRRPFFVSNPAHKFAARTLTSTRK